MNKSKKKILGRVVSDKMDKTITVSVDRIKIHFLYKKKFTVTKKYKASDEKNRYKEGDIVEIVETKPKSHDKKFKVLRKIEK